MTARGEPLSGRPSTRGVGGSARGVLGSAWRAERGPSQGRGRRRDGRRFRRQVWEERVRTPSWITSAVPRAGVGLPQDGRFGTASNGLPDLVGQVSSRPTCWGRGPTQPQHVVCRKNHGTRASETYPQARGGDLGGWIESLGASKKRMIGLMNAVQVLKVGALLGLAPVLLWLHRARSCAWAIPNRSTG